MAAGDKLGTIFYCLPRPIGVFLIGLLWVVWGGWHSFVISEQLISGWATSSEDWGEQSCQGSQCHNEWREQLISCKGTRKNTFHIRYIAVGIVGLLAGFVGMNGVTSHNHVQVKTFSGVMFFMIGLFIFCLTCDLTYVQFCGTMPTNMAKDVLFWLPREIKHTLVAQGFQHIERLPVKRLKSILRFDFVSVYIGLFVAFMLFGAYVAYRTFQLGGDVEGGPLGLGPVYVISTDPNKQIYRARERFDQLLDEIQGGVPQYDTLLALQDAQKFPYLSTRGARPAIDSYGIVGVDKDLLKDVDPKIHKPKMVVL